MFFKYAGGEELGVLLILISALFFVLGSYFGKVVTLTTDMTAVITSFSRFLLGTIIMFFYILYKKESFRPNNIKTIAARAVLNSISIIMITWALQYTTITNTNMLNMTYPVYVILFAPFITKEENNKSTYFYLLAIMLGSYIVSNPSFGSINKGDFMASLSAIIAGIAVLCLTMASRYDKSYIIVFYVMLIGTFINIPFAFKDIYSFDFTGIIPVFLAALFGFLGQVFLTLGYKYVDSATGSLVSTSGIVMAAIVGTVFLAEPFNLRIITGVLIITISLIGISGFFDNRIPSISSKLK